MSRRTVGALVLGALLATGVFIVTGAGTNAVSVNDSERFIQVSAGGSVEGEPDSAVVNLAVEATADDASTARSMVASNVSSMRSALSDIGVTDDELRTTGFAIHETRRQRRPREPGRETEETEFVARHSFEIELGSVDEVGNVIDTAVDNGATRVDDVRFTLSESTRRQLRSEALRDAMSNARSQAGTLADDAGLGVAGVRSVSTTDFQISPVRFQAEAFASDAGGGAGTDVVSGPVTVNANVNVVYDVSR